MKFSTVFLATLIACFGIQAAKAAKPTPEEVKAITQKVADWQIKTFEDSSKYRALSDRDRQRLQNGGRPLAKHHDLTWHHGALYAGMNQWRGVADDPVKYADWLYEIGQRNGWNPHKRKYHADDHTVGQFYLSMYEDFKDPAMIGPIRARFDDILAHPKTGTLLWNETPTDAHNRWGWCDALFMAPPVWARLAKITGDQKYLDFMDQEYHATCDLLWDKEESLFWRDSSFFEKREENGEKIFWARGNGWVFGGLALMLPDLPKDWKGREFYVDLYKTMAARLKTIQREDGTWSMGLLGGVEGYPVKETSGTSFFTFGLAWGINNGILDRATYEPAVLKGWQALTQCVTEEGLLGYVQPVGAAPGDSYPDKTEVYGIGAFLAAGTEVYKMLGGTVNPAKPRLSAGRPTATPDQSSKTNETRTFCRFVPERQDDFAWENDLIAFRAYGPALRSGAENSGIDCWLKRVTYPIIDKWYAEASNGKSYHQDHGEGLDNYHVGSSAGTGGTGLWLNGKREPLETYTKYEVIESTPARSIFKLSYEREIDGVVYGEEKTITIELGSRLFDVSAVFTKDGEIAAGLPICIGVTTHDGKAKPISNKEQGWIACWENLDASELGTAAMMAPERIDEIRVVEAKDATDTDAGHILLLTKSDENGMVRYRAGYGWKKAGVIKSEADWEMYLNAQ
ncbi:Unsaturated rhamnogalacturonyl hydrolase YteR [Novipirellula aureliae]|uniref:Unsaturated rhamnogalacturonyl hydrolase YteR n=1 Tax=Novipirellula aureliae TaxID=2527966 RepID=A0A5C6E9R1_9BACT|nr:glycoside hydrolase family 88 protein [Novipirellula aureliae]TWU45578.1 Unsaturated rhamnogalacturonyl hydrolase YteR [Novipirellula aureliae]